MRFFSDERITVVPKNNMKVTVLAGDIISILKEEIPVKIVVTLLKMSVRRKITHSNGRNVRVLGWNNAGGTEMQVRVKGTKIRDFIAI